MPLVIGPNEFTQPDYTVTYVDGDRRLKVGRIFYGPASSPQGMPWVWTVEWHQREGRTPPGQGNAATEDEAKAAWKRCWESASAPDQLAQRLIMNDEDAIIALLMSD